MVANVANSPTSTNHNNNKAASKKMDITTPENDINFQTSSIDVA